MMPTANESKKVVTKASAVNQEFYSRLAAGRHDYWKWMAAPRIRVETLVAEAIRIAPRRLVDLGCGDGTLLQELAHGLPGLSLSGVDLAEPQIEANRRRAPEVSWHCLDLDGVARFPAELLGSFDLVIASEILEHLDHPGPFLADAFRLAVPGKGALLLSTQSGPIRETERRVGHVRHWEANELGELLVASGWEPERIWNCGFPFHDLSKWMANLAPGASFEQFGERPYGVPQKLVCAVLRGLFRLNSGSHGAQLFAVARRRAETGSRQSTDAGSKRGANANAANAVANAVQTRPQVDVAQTRSRVDVDDDKRANAVPG